MNSFESSDSHKSMQFNKALKILGLELGRGDKVKVNPFHEAGQANKTWHESASWYSRGQSPQAIEHRRQIERADWHIMEAWETLAKFFCRMCGYVVSPDRYHRHCPDCKRLLSHKEYPLGPETIRVIETCPKCGEIRVSIID